MLLVLPNVCSKFATVAAVVFMYPSISFRDDQSIAFLWLHSIADIVKLPHVLIFVSTLIFGFMQHLSVLLLTDYCLHGTRFDVVSEQQKIRMCQESNLRHFLSPG